MQIISLQDNRLFQLYLLSSSLGRRRCGSARAQALLARVECCVSVSPCFLSVHGRKWQIMHEAPRSTAVGQGDPREQGCVWTIWRSVWSPMTASLFTLHAAFFPISNRKGCTASPYKSIYTFISAITEWDFIHTQMVICQIMRATHPGL